MIDNGKISSSQLVILLILLVTATAILFVPALSAAVADKDGWISLLIPATIFGMLVVFVCAALGLRFPGRSFSQYTPEIIGLIPAKAVSVLYVLFLIHIIGIIVNEFGSFLVVFMPETPMEVFNIVLLLLAISAARNGIEVIARMGEFIFFLFILSVLLILVMVIPEIELGNVIPVMEKGLGPVLQGSLVANAFRGEVFVILFLLPCLNRPQEVTRSGIWAVVIIGIIVTLDTFFTVAVLGDELTESLILPLFSLARYISIGEFIERVEALVMIMWVAGVTVKVSLLLYTAVITCAQTFGFSDYRMLAYPAGLIIFGLSGIMFDNTMELVEFISYTWPAYSYTFEFVIPAIILILAIIRKKGGKQGGKK